MIKIILFVLGIAIVAFIAVQIFAMKAQNKIESYSYTLEKSFGTFEIRNYEASLFTSVKLPMKNYKKGASEGFSILAEYIFGGNDKNEKISMTSPVTVSLEDTMTMMFLVPKKFNKESLPKPDQSKIEFREEPKKTVAAITFGGWADDENIQVYKDKLINLLKEEGIKHTNKFSFLGYNPPFEVFNRKNEVIVEL